MISDRKRKYIIIGLILIVITIIEVGYPYATKGVGQLDQFYKPVLALLSALKFILVVGFFMHLKYDNKLLKVIFAFSLLITVMFFSAFIYLFNLT